MIILRNIVHFPTKLQFEVTDLKNYFNSNREKLQANCKLV